MECVKSGKPYVQQYPIDSPNPKFKQEIDAAKLWQKITHNAWKSAEPGVLFWDTIHKFFLSEKMGKQKLKWNEEHEK